MLDGTPKIARPIAPWAQAALTQLGPDALLGRTGGWRQSRNLTEFLTEMFASSPAVGGGNLWARAKLAVLALKALDFANMLIYQMGAEPLADPNRFALRSEGESPLHLGLDWSGEVRRAAVAAIEEARKPPGPGPARAAFVLLESGGSSGRASGLTKDGASVLWQQSLGDFVKRMVAPAARLLDGSLPALRAACRHRLAASESALRDLSPEVAEAVSCVRYPREDAALRLRYCEAGGVPHDVCMRLEPHERNPRVCISIYRAVPETVLESSNSQFFYFPPVQVECRIGFEGEGNESLHVYRPRVRAPKGSYFVIGPYTGALETSPRVEWRNSRDPEAMFEMSEAGRRLLPPGTAPNDSDLESDVCLNGHESSVHEIAERVLGALGRGQRPDLFHNLCRPVLSIAVAGLCNGAQDNCGMPRAHLAEGEMPIIRDRKLIRGELANRVFPFHRAGARRQERSLIEMLLETRESGEVPF